MNITQFTMENVRCFSERQTLEIRPLTFLVGENSTGKTTALACFHVLADYLRGRGMDFNSHPYSMGTFRDIVRNSKKKEKNFQLGFTYKHNNENIRTTVELVEKNKGLEPTVNWVAIKLTDGEIVIQVENTTKQEPRLDSFDEKQNQYKIICGTDILNEPRVSLFLRPYFFTSESKGEISFLRYLDRTSDKFEESIYLPWDVFKTLSVFSTSPVRSRPKRTYDPTREFDDPEGSDVPMYLIRIEATGKKNWEVLKTQLVEFGRNSGLFENIDVKNLGRSLGAPFQLQVKVRGPKANINDVGYGVSQILPILVQILNPSISKNAQRDPTQSFFFYYNSLRSTCIQKHRPNYLLC